MNGLNALIKRPKVTKQMKNRTPQCAAHKRLTQTQRHVQTEREGPKKILHGNGSEEKPRQQQFISDKIDFKTKTAAGDKEGDNIMIKGSIQKEDRRFINIYIPTIQGATDTEQILTDIEKLSDSNCR